MTDSAAGSTAPPRRFPPWLVKRIPCGGSGGEVRELLRDLHLHTVCASARCPNQGECYGKGRATFLLLGPHCTRACTFCAVTREAPFPADPTEPERVATAVARLRLRHAVVTSVTRDDLPDGGAAHFAATVEAIRRQSDCTIELLVPDFQGDPSAIDRVAAARPEILNHNLETVPRLYPAVRPGASYRQSLELLRRLRGREDGPATKSGLMLGLGETEEEVTAVIADLAGAGCRILTLGQYLAPTPRHHPVAAYIEPGIFERLGDAARRAGIEYVASAPFVRSSYNAEEVFDALRAAAAE